MGTVFTSTSFILHKAQQLIPCIIGNLLIKNYKVTIYPKSLPSELKCKRCIRHESKPRSPDLPAAARKLISSEQMVMGIRKEHFWQPVTGG